MKMSLDGDQQQLQDLEDQATSASQAYLASEMAGERCRSWCASNERGATTGDRLFFMS